MLRRRLAEVYRFYGDAADAGRWMYLEEDRNADETAAFEARYGSPGWRMKALAWQGPEAKAATVFAEKQLIAVRTACVEELGIPSTGTIPPSTGTAAWKGSTRRLPGHGRSAATKSDNSSKPFRLPNLIPERTPTTSRSLT